MEQYCKHDFVKEVLFGQRTGDWVCKKCKEVMLTSSEIEYFTKNTTKEKILQNQKLIACVASSWNEWESWIKHEQVSVKQIVTYVYDNFGFLP